MKQLRTSAAVASVAACVLVFAGVIRADASETEQFDRTIPFHSGGRIRLNNFSGKVTITGGDSNDVVIHALRHASRERLDHIKIDVQADANEITIEANHRDSSWRDHNDNVVETDFEIQVPRQSDLDIKVFSSKVDVSGVAGSQKLHAFSGDLRVSGAAGAIDAETFSGDIEVAFAATPNGQIDFDSFSGRISSERPITVHTSSRHSRMQGDIGSGGDTQFRFKTFSGDVTLR